MKRNAVENITPSWAQNKERETPKLQKEEGDWSQKVKSKSSIVQLVQLPDDRYPWSLRDCKGQPPPASFDAVVRMRKKSTSQA